MRGKIEHSVALTDHNKMLHQKGALEKLCRVLQSENKELRKRLPEFLPSHPLPPSNSVEGLSAPDKEQEPARHA